MRIAHLLILFAVVSRPASAAVLAGYAFTDGSLLSQAGVSGSVASPLVVGPGLSFGTAVSSSSPGSGILAAGERAAGSFWTWQGDHGVDFADAVSKGSFISFTITSDPGRFLTLESLTFAHRGVSPNQIWSLAVTTSINNHSVALGNFTGKDFDFTPREVELPRSANLTSLEIRIYFMGDRQTGNAPERGQGINNLKVSGGVTNAAVTGASGGSPVPEPSGALVGLVVAAALVSKRTTGRGGNRIWGARDKKEEPTW